MQHGNVIRECLFCAAGNCDEVVQAVHEILQADGSASRGREESVKPLKTLQRWAKLSGVFSKSDTKLNALLAPLCVLFEDLRIEIAGISSEDLPGMDECGKTWRRLYFQRRSFATLHEFGLVLHELQDIPSFQNNLITWDSRIQRQWDASQRYFKRHRTDLGLIRHNAGGHFQAGAGKQAVRNMDPGAVGSMEICEYSGGGGAKLHFAGEVAATVVLSQVRGHTPEQKVRRMSKVSLIGYHHAVRAVDCLTVSLLWDRFR